MKVLHLLQSNHFSGAENVVCQIINMMKDEPDLEMVYVSRDGQIRKALEERNITFVPINKMNVSEVKRVISEQKPDIIHAHDRNACVFASLTCKNIPIVAHMHVNNNKGFKFFIKNFLWFLMSKKFRHIFFVSDSSFEGFQFKSFIKKKSSVLYNVIDVDALYKRIDEDENNYNYDAVYVGRLTYQKNPERLMEVLKKTVLKKNDIKVAIIGNGTHSKYVEEYINDNDLENNIEYLGFIGNPMKIIKNAKVLVMTSRFEGTPMTVLEAQCLGVPVVSTPVDGLLKVIDNGVNGYLSDDDNELASFIRDVINKDSLHVELKENSLNKAKVYNDIDNFRNEISKAYSLCK